MAVIASAETLLCATAVDRMHGGPRTQYDRELAAQGLGNIICGAVGALPMTGVIVRSAANVQAGGTIAALGHLARPVAVDLRRRARLSAADDPHGRAGRHSGLYGLQADRLQGLFRAVENQPSEAAILLITVVVIVVEDLLMGVVTGIVLSAIKLLITFSHLDVRLVRRRRQAWP